MLGGWTDSMFQTQFGKSNSADVAKNIQTVGIYICMHIHKKVSHKCFIILTDT